MPLRLRGNDRSRKRRALPELRALPGEKEKCPVLDDGPAERDSVLVALQTVVGGGKKVPRVDLVVANVFVERAVESVGAGPGHHVDDPAAAPAKLGRIVVGLETELLDRIRVGRDIRHFGVGIFVEPAIQHERGGVATAAAGGDQLGPHFRPRGTLVERAAAHQRTRRQLHQLQDIAAVEWQIVNLLLVDDSAEGGGARVDRGSLGAYADGLGNRADFQRDFDGSVLVHFQNQLRDALRLESRLADGDGIWASRQCGDHKVAEIIRLHRAFHAGGQISNDDARARRRGFRCIHDGTRD